MRLGGIFAWGVEQGRFSGELLRPEIALACEEEQLLIRRSPPVPGVRIIQTLPVSGTSIASFQAMGKSGEALVVLASLSEEIEKLSVDTRLIEFLVGMLPRHVHYIYKTDLVRLIEDIAVAAGLDGDLDEEARGLRLGERPDWFDAPRIVLQTDNVLVETELGGVGIEALSNTQRAITYCNAVTNWARMLLDDGILNVTLRRDRLRIQGTRLGLTRWTGTRQSSAASVELIRSLVLAAFASSTSARATANDLAAQLLADGLGMEGSLKDVETFCLSLISENGRLILSRRNFPLLVARQSDRYSQDERVEIFQLLRQLVWLRDLGHACGVDDLSRPWRDLASALEGTC